MSSGLKTTWRKHIYVLAILAAAPGCSSVAPRPQVGMHDPLLAGAGLDSVPTEKNKSTLPAYVIEAPDILLIETIRLVPKPPYKIEALDVLQILVVGTFQGQDISGQFPVDPAGTINLGPAYGKVEVAGLDVDEARQAVTKHLKAILRAPEVSITLAQSAGQQPVAGEHVVGPDGTVNLGTYGRVYVAGMTIRQARQAIEEQLGKSLLNPKVSVDVFAYNSKVYYVITQGAGLGDQLSRYPATGNETVLDAIAQVNGLSRLASKKIWIARPAPGGVGCDQVLPVKWNDITAGAATQTNYQVLPGDRIFIAEDKMVALDTMINKITAPFERMFGGALLGSQTIQGMNRFPDGQTGLGGF